MRRRLPSFLLPVLAALLVSACAYKKTARKEAAFALECEASLVKVSRRGNLVKARGCGRQELYMWHCQGEVCRLNSFSDAVAEGAFAADCPPEEMVPRMIDKSRVAIDGCDRSTIFESSMKGWIKQGEDE